MIRRTTGSLTASVGWFALLLIQSDVVATGGIVERSLEKGDRHPASCDRIKLNAQSTGANPRFRTASWANAAPAPYLSLLPPAALDTQTLDHSNHPLADLMTRYVRAAPDVGFQSTGLTEADYLRVIEGQVRAMRRYQNSEGRIIDPVEKREMYYATPCYAHSVALLVAADRVTQASLIESGMKALDVALADMAAAAIPGNHGDFYTWPAMFAYELFRSRATAERQASWTKKLLAIAPNQLYRAYLNKSNNWGVVNLAGEFLRYRAGFATLEYVDKSLNDQRTHFTVLGMYNEHGNPLPYDLFPRHYLTVMLQLGYHGEQFEAYRDLLWRGAWTSLFLQSPDGELPTGYRSSQHIWNEAEQCVIFELYARVYAEAGRAVEAGAFKRAARLSLRSITEWIRSDGTGYIVKNRYPIQTRHGYETYSAHTCYNLLACSMLAQAWQFAQKDIAERPAPADTGGFVVSIVKPYHKIFTNAGGTYAEFDTCGDHRYNPTGLIRVHVKNGHPQLGPSDGCATLFSGQNVNIAIGPAWQDAGGQWHSLAAASPAAPQVDVLDQTLDKASFRVTYTDLTKPASADAVRLVSTVVVTPEAVTVANELIGDVHAVRVTWPMLVFDGERETRVQVKGNSATLRLGARGTRFTMLEPPTAQLARSGQRFKHRNGLVEPLVAECQDRRVVYRISAN